jgi:hypothetical protein
MNDVTYSAFNKIKRRRVRRKDGAIDGDTSGSDVRTNARSLYQALDKLL